METNIIIWEQFKVLIFFLVWVIGVKNFSENLGAIVWFSLLLLAMTHAHIIIDIFRNSGNFKWFMRILVRHTPSCTPSSRLQRVKITIIIRIFLLIFYIFERIPLLNIHLFLSLSLLFNLFHLFRKLSIQKIRFVIIIMPIYVLLVKLFHLSFIEVLAGCHWFFVFW